MFRFRSFLLLSVACYPSKDPGVYDCITEQVVSEDLDWLEMVVADDEMLSSIMDDNLTDYLTCSGELSDLDFYFQDLSEDGESMESATVTLLTGELTWYVADDTTTCDVEVLLQAFGESGEVKVTIINETLTVGDFDITTFGQPELGIEGVSDIDYINLSITPSGDCGAMGLHQVDFTYDEWCYYDW